MSSQRSAFNISSEELTEVCLWMKSFHLSKEIKNFHRDLADGVLVAEILKLLYPKFVDLHNYPKCNSTLNKLNNWRTLNQKVLRRLNICLDEKMLLDLANGDNGVLEALLFELMAKQRLDSYKHCHYAEPAANILTLDGNKSDAETVHSEVQHPVE
uniref:Calponin-homology (CH) domain-containing protein n=1 Tax=Anopheles atroparvus TaxID=41427 RepID=A0AAG5D997_ANOAO